MFEWEILLGAVLISFLGAYAVIRLAPRMGLLHAPNDRSSHSVIIPHGGGLGIVLAGSIAGCWLMTQAQEIWLVGLADDIWHLSAKWRFALQGSVVAVLVWLVAPLPEMAFSLPQMEAVGFIGGWLLVGLLFCAGLWWLNLFNFMDGIDGIAVLQALSMLSAAGALSLVADPVLRANRDLW